MAIFQLISKVRRWDMVVVKKKHLKSHGKNKHVKFIIKTQIISFFPHSTLFSGDGNFAHSIRSFSSSPLPSKLLLQSSITQLVQAIWFTALVISIADIFAVYRAAQVANMWWNKFGWNLTASDDPSPHKRGCVVFCADPNMRNAKINHKIIALMCVSSKQIYTFKSHRLASRESQTYDK